MNLTYQHSLVQRKVHHCQIHPSGDTYLHSQMTHLVASLEAVIVYVDKRYVQADDWTVTELGLEAALHFPQGTSGVMFILTGTFMVSTVPVAMSGMANLATDDYPGVEQATVNSV